MHPRRRGVRTDRLRRIKVVFSDTHGGDALEQLRARLPDFEIARVDADRLGDALVDADAFVGYRLTSSDTARAARLRLVQTMSAGTDGVDRDAVPEGAVLCNVRGHERTIAEWVLMALLALPRQVVVLDRDLREGLWHRHGGDPLDVSDPELEAKSVALVGYGQIGRAVEELVSRLGARTIAFTRRPGDRARALDELADALGDADFAVVSLPASAGTVIGRRELEALGPAGYLVNGGRGSGVDEEALYEAMREHRIAGAAVHVR